ncbi:MAG: hypothetical protein IT379_16680 [Deltaproteobacteria bacterium]|nr:hypothetical protein [Deltaproteobacteria bacterium]
MKLALPLEISTALRNELTVQVEQWTPDAIARAEAVLADYLALHARQLAGEDVRAELAQAEAASLMIVAAGRQQVRAVLHGALQRVVRIAVGTLFAVASGG